MSILELPELSELAKSLLIKRTLSNSAVESGSSERDGCHVSVNLARYSSMTTRRSFISRHRHHTLAHWSVSRLIVSFCRQLLIILFSFAQQHKAAGLKTNNQKLSRSVAKRCIRQQKCLNGQIGTCLLGTRWYNF